MLVLTAHRDVRACTAGHGLHHRIGHPLLPGKVVEADGHLSGPDELAGHAWIGWEETAAGIHAVDWLRRAAPASAFVYRTSSLLNQFAAARAGIGLALLPCYLGDGDPEIVRALPTPWPS